MLVTLKKFLRTNFNYKLVWLVVISSILLSLVGTRIEMAGENLIDHDFYRLLLSPFNDVRYGHFIVRKLFLAVIAFLVFGYWLKTRRGVLQSVKKNLKYIVSIGVVLFVSRILTYGFWFYNDDTRFFHWHLFAPTQPGFNPQGMWGPIGLHPIAILNLVMPWFGPNYTLYNSLGLFFYFLAGVAIFVLLNKIQKNKFLSFLAAVFFLTTPTYFQGRLLIGEIINSPFILLLVILSIYMLLQKFVPEALIFTAAALEYGVAKSYFIALPLTLFAVFFAKNMQKKKLISFLAAIFLMSLVYLPAFYGAPSAQGKTLALDQLFVYGDVLLAVTLPFGLSFPLVHLLSLLLNGWIYITAALGFLIVACFTIIAIISYVRGQTVSAKLIIIGLSIILPTTAIASFMGVRVDHNVQKLVEYHNNSLGPLGATAYGFFPALGLTFTLVGLGLLFRKRTLKMLALSLIFINIITSFSFDYRWLQSPYSYPQRRYDEQLQKILPRDGINRYIFVPGTQRSFYQGVITFSSVYQGDQGLYTFMGAEDFVEALKTKSAQKDHIYFLVTNGNPKYDIYDYSQRIRSVPYDQLVPLVKSLAKELPPKSADFTQ